MNIELFLTPNDIDSETLSGKTVVVIDVLRASTSITTAVQNHCRQIIPVAEVETAKNLFALQSKETTLLCGERNARKVAGFHLGNSPAEYTTEKVKNKTLIFTSTNGARLMAKVQSAKIAYIAGFVNMTEVVGKLLADKNDIAVCCSGRYNQFALEDTVCAGMIITRLYKQLPDNLKINDLVLMAMILYQKFEDNLMKMFHLSVHGRFLISIGLKNDVITCGNVDSIGIVPVYRKGVISLPPVQP